MRLSKTTASLLALGLTVLLSGCEAEQTEKDMLAEAQYCLDKATKDTAGACLSKISGLTAPQAYALRCAAGFIAADVTSPENLAAAMNAISENSGATGLLSAISFPSQPAADQTFDYCNLSQQGGMALIGAMAKSATILSNVAKSLPSCSDLTQCTDAVGKGIQELIDTPDPAKVGAIVDAVSTIYDVSCSAGNSSSNEMCKQIDSAAAIAEVDIANLSEEDKAELGKRLLEQWKN